MTPPLAGDILVLTDVAGNRVEIRRRGDAAPGRFQVRRRSGTTYVQFEYFLRGKPFQKVVYIGIVRDPEGAPASTGAPRRSRAAGE